MPLIESTAWSGMTAEAGMIAGMPRTTEMVDSIVEKFMRLTNGQFLNLKDAHYYHSFALSTLDYAKSLVKDRDVQESVAVMHSLLDGTKILHRSGDLSSVEVYEKIDEVKEKLNDHCGNAYFIIGTEGMFKEELEIQKWFKSWSGETLARPLIPFIESWLNVFDRDYFAHPYFQPEDVSAFQLLKKIAPKSRTPHTILDLDGLMNCLLDGKKVLMNPDEIIRLDLNQEEGIIPTREVPINLILDEIYDRVEGITKSRKVKGGEV